MPRVRYIIAALLLAVLSSIGARAQSIYAVVWGHPMFVVGSSTLHSGLFRSTDLGRTWSHMGPRNLKAFSMDAVDLTLGRILFIAAGNGVHRSIDSGRTWKIVTDWRVTEVLDVHVDQREPRNILAATAYGLWLSSDGGDTWSNPGGSLQSVFVREIFGSDPMYAYTEDEWSPDGEYGYWQAPAGTLRWSALGSIRPSAPLRIGNVSSHGDRWTIGNTTLVGTWGDGVYREEAGSWHQSGLEGSQVWRLVVKRY